MSFLQVKYDELVNPDGTYTIAFKVLIAQGIPDGVFVYLTDGNTYNHVATVFDLNTYPEGLALAEATIPPIAFYRVNSASLTLKDKPTALDASQQILTRLKVLNDSWQAATGSIFGGSQVISYDSGYT